MQFVFNKTKSNSKPKQIQSLPNIITLSRMVLSPFCIFLWSYTFTFVLVYLACGLSDVLDGYLARKLHLQSEIGARLDSLADLWMYGSILALGFRYFANQLWIYWSLLITAVAIRTINLLITLGKYHRLNLLHTWGNKITGFLVFISPLLLKMIHGLPVIPAIITVAILSAVEESLIHLLIRQPNVNRRSLFFK